MEIPLWNAGDQWAYADYVSPGASNVTATIEYQVLGTETLRVGNQSYSTYHMVEQIPLGGTAGMATNDQWYDASDLGLLREEDVIPNVEVRNLTYVPPLGLRWPLSPNASWSTTGIVNVTDQYTGYPPQSYLMPYIEQFTVGAQRELTVPAGTFSAYPILKGSLSSGVVRYWSPSVGNFIREDNVRSGCETMDMALVSYGHNTSPAPGPTFPLLFGLGTASAVAIIAIIIFIRRRKPPPVGELEHSDENGTSGMKESIRKR